MKELDPTTPAKIEPTEQASTELANLYSTYGNGEIPTPPPPPRKRFKWPISLVGIILALLFIGTALGTGYVMSRPARTTQAHKTRASVTTVLKIKTPEGHSPTPVQSEATQPTAIPIVTAYTIINDFQSHGLAVGGVIYNDPSWPQFTKPIGVSSSASFHDDQDSHVWLGVFSNPESAQAASDNLVSEGFWGVTVANRCILTDEPADSLYTAIVEQDCK